MITDTKKIIGLLLSVGFSSIGFIAAITVTVLAAREVSNNPLFLGFPNAVGVGGASASTSQEPLVVHCLFGAPTSTQASDGGALL